MEEWYACLVLNHPILIIVAHLEHMEIFLNVITKEIHNVIKFCEINSTCDDQYIWFLLLTII